MKKAKFTIGDLVQYTYKHEPNKPGYFYSGPVGSSFKSMVVEVIPCITSDHDEYEYMLEDAEDMYVYECELKKIDKLPKRVFK